ncbi:50S ribosomal protein L35 [Patescibacteria group bacterium]|nr:50S ribosomal protein L35 [Patescibacteria group bacterium]MBU0777079.1 50S ribosomal protein L35 [Patescibacteria group bacterium]MBU0845773.1 50S ribosomal protein L35 [Patescibacteria group bacterium]MBU0922800.1 50S ribosomal protein L35 [Patescibacteria group bacterium]MBU1066467.1 50S ribosomal protein L35 [Patescibacteria group bacterium]
MPKQKTRKSITKRFRVTKTGKVMRRRSFARHLNEKKSSSRKRALRRTVETKKSYAKRIKKALGKGR